MSNNIGINSDTNKIEITNSNNNIVVVNDSPNIPDINITQPVTSIIQINTPGPTGPIGPTNIVDTGSFVTTSSFNNFTQSYYQDSASFVNAITNITLDLSSFTTTSSFNLFTSSYNTGSFTGSFTGDFIGTASWAQNYNEQDPIFTAKSASLATTGSNTFDGNQYITGSVDITGSLTVNTVNVGANTLNFIDDNKQILTSLTIVSGNLFLTSGSVQANDGFSGSLFGTASWANNYNEQDPIFTAKSSSFTTTSSFNQFTQSYYSDSSSFDLKITDLTNATSSYVLNSQTGSFATTGSNIFKASQTITGSLTITNDLIVLGSSSITYISQSTLDISTNLITVNTITPSVRFGGLAVIDSGSSPQTSGSILFDSQNNQWIFVHQNTDSQITSSVFIQGPQTFNDLGNEITISTNRLTKGVGGDLGEHIGDSNITDTGILVSINSNTEITGSLIVTNDITGSLFGTSSWAQNYNETDPIFTSKSGSFVTTSSFNLFTSSYNTGSFTGSFIGDLTGTATTASYVLNAVSASFATTASYAQNAGVSENLAIAYAIALG